MKPPDLPVGASAEFPLWKAVVSAVVISVAVATAFYGLTFVMVVVVAWLTGSD